MRVPLASIALASLFAFSPASFASPEHAPSASPAPSAGQKLPATQAALRDLWVGHIFWVRDVVRGLADKDDAAVKVAEAQVVENAKAIAGSVEPFYGKAASNQLFELLAGHYGAIKAHASATVAGKSAEAKKAFDDLVANANAISEFLSGANPHLPKNVLSSMLLAHGGHHVKQNEQIAKGDLKAEARTWEEMKTHIYAISDALAGALAKQFPEKFS